MLTVFIASFVFFLLAIAGMSLGYIVKNKNHTRQLRRDRCTGDGEGL